MACSCCQNHSQDGETILLSPTTPFPQSPSQEGLCNSVLPGVLKVPSTGSKPWFYGWEKVRSQGAGYLVRSHSMALAGLGAKPKGLVWPRAPWVCFQVPGGRLRDNKVLQLCPGGGKMWLPQAEGREEQVLTECLPRPHARISVSTVHKGTVGPSGQVRSVGLRAELGFGGL